MTKKPTTPFAWLDWSKDLHEHPLVIEGAWIRICCRLHYSDTRGELSKTEKQWSRVLGIDQGRCLNILRYIKTEKIGVVRKNSNGKITVSCRRMLKEEKAKYNNRLRQERFRELNKITESNAQKVLDYFNLKAGRRFLNSDQIHARLRDGGTVEQCKYIIDIKMIDPYFKENPRYLNPSTLFRQSHWDTYLNQKPEDFKKERSDNRPPIPYVDEVVEKIYGD